VGRLGGTNSRLGTQGSVPRGHPRRFGLRAQSL